MKRQMIDAEEQLSIRRQCEILGIARESIYYVPKGENPENLAMMRLMDEHILEEPTAGVLTMQSMLKDNNVYPSSQRIHVYDRYHRRLQPIYSGLGPVEYAGC